MSEKKIKYHEPKRVYPIVFLTTPGNNIVMYSQTNYGPRYDAIGFLSHAGKLRVGQLQSRAAGGVPAVQVVGLSVHVGVRAQRDRAQGPAAADVQRRGRTGRHVRVYWRRRVAASRAAAAPATAPTPAAVRARAIRGQRVSAQSAVQDRVVRAQPLAAQHGRHAAHGQADGRRVRVSVPRRRQQVPASPAGVQRRGRLSRFPVER